MRDYLRLSNSIPKSWLIENYGLYFKLENLIARQIFEGQFCYSIKIWILLYNVPASFRYFTIALIGYFVYLSEKLKP